MRWLSFGPVWVPEKFMRRILHVAAILAAGLVCAGADTGMGTAPLEAPRTDSTGKCSGDADPDKAIAACSRVIDLALTADSKLAWAYNSRGNAYMLKRDFARA